MSECTTCGEQGKTEKAIKLSENYDSKYEQGKRMAIDAGANGFFIALSKNSTGYIVDLARPEGSSLQWSFVNIT